MSSSCSDDSDVEEVCESKQPFKRSKRRSNDDNENDADDEEVISISSTDSDENEDDETPLPSGAECLKRCKEFVEITSTDSALAMFYLQDTKYDLNKAIDAYFSATQSSKSKIVACFDVNQLENDEAQAMKNTAKSSSSSSSSSSRNDDSVLSEEMKKGESPSSSFSQSSSASSATAATAAFTEAAPQKRKRNTDAIATTATTTSESASSSSKEDKHFKLLSWNIDGLDQVSLEARTEEVISTIIREKPDIVFLQEVVVASQRMLINKLSHLYDMCSGNEDFDDFSSMMMSSMPIELLSKLYYTMILSKKSTCKRQSYAIHPFKNTAMMRNLLQAQFVYKGILTFHAMTAHLESTKDFAEQRMEQLKESFAKMKAFDADLPVFFGGDLNLRDTELAKLGGLPSNIHDVWQATGSRKECLYTWDQLRNDNLRLPGKFKPRCRFDRLYYRQAVKTKESEMPSWTLMPVYFELEGLTKPKNCARFPSDHWAIQSYCQVEELK